jgi:hypothetical protein
MFNQYFVSIIGLIFLINSSESQTSNTELAAKLDQLNRESLRCHNEKRRVHNVPELKLNAELVFLAQNEAEKLSKLGKLQFNDVMYRGEKVGENLWSKSTSVGNLGEESCESWYSRSSAHNFQGDWNLATGAFSQMIWKNSKEIGSGMATSSNGWTTVVVLYYPVGNVISQFRSNVLPSNSFLLSPTTTTKKSSTNLDWITASTTKFQSITEPAISTSKSLLDSLTTKSQMQLTFTKSNLKTDEVNEKEKLYSLIGKLYAQRLQ